MDAFEKMVYYDVNVLQFVRLAIADKIKCNWHTIKENKEKVKLPF